MSNDENSLIAWTPNQPAELASNAQVSDITEVARSLTPRDVTSITVAFESQAYEMVSTFVWTKTVTALKKQVASLGMEFVGQMLGRPDIDDDSDPTTAISEHDALSLAEDLGMVSATEALRLKHSMELVGHFADPEHSSQDQMNEEEAKGILRSCVASVLANPHIKPPIQFAELREALGEESFQRSDKRIDAILASPYFMQKTVLSVLLSLLKTANGAQLEHGVGNTNVIVPRLWSALRKPEKWQVGQTYAEIHSAGRRAAAVGLRNALAAVQGFDFVPETLRSDTFARAAKKVLDAHFSFDNYHKEATPTSELASLGSTIPKPAFPICMQAVLAVRLGNSYGVAYAAQGHANEVLTALRVEQWEYYLNECLPGDKTILDILVSDKPARRWAELTKEFSFKELDLVDPLVEKIASATSFEKVQSVAMKLRSSSAKRRRAKGKTSKN